MHSSTAPQTPPSTHLRIVRAGERTEEPLDPSDFDAVYRRFSPYVATIGLRILGRPADVDDLVQEVFLAAHDGLGSIHFPEKIRGWLKTIAVRKAMVRLRRAKLRRWLSFDDAPSYELLADPSATPEERAEVARLYEKLDRLDPKDRVVFVLRHVEQNTLDEVAEHSGLSKSTVQRKLRKVEALLNEGGERD